MPELENIRINTGNPDDRSTVHYIESTQGYLKASHRYTDNSYEVQDYFVWDRGKGYGKELLRVALEHARALGARAVTASEIVTRESVDAMSSVFGSDSLDVEWVGGYALEGKEPVSSAKATMVFEIPQQELPHTSYEQAVADSLKSIHPHIRAFNDDILALNSQIRALDEQSSGRPWQLSDPDRKVYEAVFDLRQLLMQQRERTERKIAGEEMGYLVRYANEIDPRDYSNLLVAPDVPDTFHIPNSIDIANKKQVSYALEALPFRNLSGHYRSLPRKPAENIIGPIEFPIDRIIGVDEPFQSWAGRGLHPDDENPDYSLEKIVNFAQMSADQFRGIGSAAHILVVKDHNQNLWGIATNDGSHRTAASKLRGDKYIEVSEIIIPDVSEMPIITL